MYLRPDEVARVLEKVGFYCRCGNPESVWLPPWESTLYVNREARMGRLPALVIHPTLKERSSTLAEPASDIKTEIITSNFRSLPQASDTSITVSRMASVGVSLNVI